MQGSGSGGNRTPLKVQEVRRNAENDADRQPGFCGGDDAGGPRGRHGLVRVPAAAAPVCSARAEEIPNRNSLNMSVKTPFNQMCT